MSYKKIEKFRHKPISSKFEILSNPKEAKQQPTKKKYDIHDIELLCEKVKQFG